MIVGLRADGSTRGVIMARILPQRLGVERRRFLGLSRNDPIHVRTGYQARPAPEGTTVLLRLNIAIAYLATGLPVASAP